MGYRAARDKRGTPEGNRDEAIKNGQSANDYDFRITLNEVRRKHFKRIDEINAVTYLLFENYSSTYPEISSDKLFELAVSQTPLVLKELGDI
jgi:hypothetical protein